MVERMLIWTAWRLPRRLVYWAAIRLTAEASVTFHDKEMGAITAQEALRVW